MSKHLGYLPKLDALRAIAALMVLCAHYLIEVSSVRFDYGGYGVQVFFVISGFLITTILLSQKEKVHLARSKLISHFIIKRAIRLFPVYFLVITVLFIISYAGNLWICGKGDGIHYFTYTQNFLFFVKGWQSPLLNHTWSLAVEEQFYLVWPFLLLLIPRRSELFVLITVFLVGVASRIYFMEFYPLTGTVKGMTLIHFETLGAGALLAWVKYYRKETVLRHIRRWAPYLFITGLIGSGVLAYFTIYDAYAMPSFVLFMSAGIVFLCTEEKKFFLDPVLNLTILQRIGRISYGVYLYHKLVPFFVSYAIEKAGYTMPDQPVVLFLCYTAIALIISALSWKLIEKPLLRVKDRFDF